MRLLSAILITLVLVGASEGQTTMPVTKEKVIYQKTLTGGGKLAVALDPKVEPALASDLLSAKRISRTAYLFAIRLELRPPSGPSWLLWAGSGQARNRSEYDEYAVLDMVVLPERIIWTLAAPGGSISVSDLDLVYGNRGASLPAVDWSLLAAAIPNTPGRLSAKLNCSDAKRVEVEVTDHVQNMTRHSLFRQKPDKWEFERVKQWEETIP